MKKIIVYDFDKTIYGGETSTDFMLFFLKRNPKYLFKIYNVLPSLFYYFINLKRSKEYFFNILNGIELNFLIKEIEAFWEKNEYRIFDWVYNEIDINKNECEELILISATPSIFLDKISKKLKFDKLIATQLKEMDIFESVIIGENCKGEEKVIRLREYIKDFEIEKFYSDSMSDKPLFDLANKKYFVINGKLKEGLPNEKY